MKWWLVTQCLFLKLVGVSIWIFTEWALLGWVVFVGGGSLVVAHIFLPRAQGLCDVVTSFQTSEKEVWLTIDDGPDPEDTPLILEALEAAGAKATFFMIGERAARYPELVEAVMAAGHSIGTHTQAHPMKGYWMAGRKRVSRELDESVETLSASGANVRLYRSPVGIKNFWLRSALRKRQLHCVAWTIRSGDGLGQDAPSVVARVERELHAGAILLMHEGPSVATAVRVDAVRGVLAMLEREGYRCVLPEAEQYLL